jgi:hypothetical protein
MSPTTAVDLLAAAYAGLSADEQEEAFMRIAEVRVARLAEAESETAVYVRALRVAAAHSDGTLSPDRYRVLRQALAAQGEELPEFSAVVRHFGTWSLAKEVIELSDVTTAKKIEARFRGRVSGRRPYFTDEELLEALKRCATALGRVPLLAEYDDWRLKELALMRTRGQWPRVASTAAVRRRFKTWEAALLAAGYTTEELYVRLEAPERRSRLAKVDRYTDETLLVTLKRCAEDIGHPPLVVDFIAWRTREIKRSRKQKLVFPSDSPYRGRFGSWRGALLACGFSEVEIDSRGRAGRARSNRNLEQRA